MKRILATLAIPVLLAVSCGDSGVGDAGPVTLPPQNSGETTTTTSTTNTTEGSGESSGSTSTTEPSPPDDSVDQVFVKLFFVRDGATAQSVLRAVDEGDLAENALIALLEGPLATETSDDLSTAIPADTLLLGLSIDDGLATVDLSREFELGGGSLNILSRLAQVVYTLTDFPDVDNVAFHLDGEPVEGFSGEGVVLDHPVARADYETILPIVQDPEVSASEAWTQDDVPAIEGIDPVLLGRVSSVAADDVLNVRQDPGAQAPIVGMLVPGVIVARTGQEQTVGTSLWVEINTPAGPFWVNDAYLATP
jgi:spore germination protein GerM